MKIIFQKEDLLYAVAAVERAVSNKNTLPVLGGILISAQNGKVCFRATDLDLAMECVIQAEILEEGECVAPGRKLSAISRLLPGGSITLFSDGDKLNLDYTIGSQTLLCFPAEEFPVLPAWEGEIEGSIPVRVFRRLVRQVGIAAATDEVRPVFTGVFTELHENEIVMVATDTHRLAIGRGVWYGNGESTLLIPNRTLQEAARLAVNEDDQITIAVGKNQVYFSYANLTFTSRVIVGQYPDYKQVLPADDLFQTTVIADRRQFGEVLERAALISRETGRGKGSAVRLEIAENRLEVAAEVPDEGMIHEDVAVTTSGDAMTVNFNARYLLDVLKVVDEERILLQLTGSSTPGVLFPDQGEDKEETDYLYLLLPIRVNR